MIFLTISGISKSQVKKKDDVTLHFLKLILLQVAQKLIEADADVNTPNAHKLIPLHLAAQNGHLALSKLLVDSGTDLDYKDLIGEVLKVTQSIYPNF